MTEVFATDEFVEWYEGLPVAAAGPVYEKVELLRERGVDLGFPHSSAIAGSAAALRELRVQAGGRPLRVFYIFDPERNAVLLVGGDKTGQKRFYETMVRRAERIWREYLGERKAKGERK